MSLTTARAEIAAALSAVDGYQVASRPSSATPKPGDGWVTISRIVPADYTRSAVTFVVVITLGADEVLAEKRLETDAVALVDAATGLLSADVSMEPATIMTGAANTPLYAATLTLTMEVEPT